MKARRALPALAILLAACTWTSQGAESALFGSPREVQVFTGIVRHDVVLLSASVDSLHVIPRGERDAARAGYGIPRTAIDSVRVQRAHPAAYVIGWGVVLPFILAFLVAQSWKGCCP